MIRTTTTSTQDFFINAFDKVILTDDRKNLLLKISREISKEYRKNSVVHLNFICTHNSRRSQLAQVWGFFAANYFKLNIHSFSGGTEVTNFYRSTIKTLQKVGFVFQLHDFSHQNPKYMISYNGTSSYVLGFSKHYNDAINRTPYIAITTCNNADENCPYIPEATNRFHMPFTDPKKSDNTDLQKQTYLKVNQQIAGEIFYIFSEVKKYLH